MDKYQYEKDPRVAALITSLHNGQSISNGIFTFVPVSGDNDHDWRVDLYAGGVYSCYLAAYQVSEEMQMIERMGDGLFKVLP